MSANPLAHRASPPWDDYQLLLTLARAGSLSAAATRLALSTSTLSRRLARLESHFGTALFRRAASGLELTDAGREAQTLAAELEALIARRRQPRETALTILRLTAVPLLVNHLLVPAAPRILRRHPNLQLNLLAEAKDLHLGRNEADLALRFNRPQDDGAALCQKLGELSYATYARRGGKRSRWIEQQSSAAELPQKSAVAAFRSSDRESAIDCSDGESVLAAARHGLGLALLPTAIANRYSELTCHVNGPTLRRELWLLTRAEIRGNRTTRAAQDWLRDTFAPVLI